ncbi:GNAT family N-acetyltransferase [Roseomonas sp. USHLN139]|uniref:GNAT family N-acetyltransferase n=1 Tax=Roseomonas sp. USHLN139 TaxID=3081298 RepID=UPI003B0194EC
MAPLPLRFETLRGDGLQPWLPQLARLRIAVFREWPYLYDGDEAYERRYMASYAAGQGAAVIACLDGDRAVGAATCEPMAETHAAVRDSFTAAGLDPAGYCYFGESVLLAPYRGRGAGVEFFHRRETHAASLGLRRTAFCAVARDPADPRRPADYTPLDGFWRKRGYAPLEGVSCRFSWKGPGEAAEQEHRLDFWHKALA